MTNTGHPRDLFRRLAAAMNSRELEQLDDILTDDFTRHCEATPDVVVNSREDFKEFLRANTLSFPDNVQTFEQVIAEGDMAGSGRPTRAPRREISAPSPPTAGRPNSASQGSHARGKAASRSSG
jgi:hypothetical protein